LKKKNTKWEKKVCGKTKGIKRSGEGLLKLGRQGLPDSLWQRKKNQSGRPLLGENTKNQV